MAGVPVALKEPDLPSLPPCCLDQCPPVPSSPCPENPPRLSPCEGGGLQGVTQAVAEPACSTRNPWALLTQASFFHLEAS